MKYILAVMFIVLVGVCAYKGIYLDENSVHNAGLNSMQTLVTQEIQIP